MKREAAVVIVLFGSVFVLAAYLSECNRQPESPLPPSPLYVPEQLNPRAIVPVETHFVLLPLVARNAPKNWIVNPGFELGYGGSCHWLDYESGWWHDSCYDEQDIPAGWQGGWVHREPCESGITGLPEMRLAERWIDERRIHSGDYAAQGFSFWRCGDWWWQATVNVPAGRYIADAWVQTWQSGVWVRVCLRDYCGPWWSSPDVWLKIQTPEMELIEGPVLVRVECMMWWPLRNSDCYVDDVGLWRH